MDSPAAAATLLFAAIKRAGGDTGVAAMFRPIAEDEGAHCRAFQAALAKFP